MPLELIKRVLRRVLRNKKDTLGYWLEKYLSEGKPTIIQIGANDGKTDDPLYQYVQKNENWQLLFVEPVGYLFDRLKKNYGSQERFEFENVGINSDGSPQPFYTIKKSEIYKENGLSEKFNQIGSFDKAHVVNLGGQLLGKDRVHAFIEEVQVSCLTLKQLLIRNNIKELDALLIDAEGYDWEILKQLDLKLYQPRIIFFEFTNLNEAEKLEAKVFLSPIYFLFRLGINLLCFSKETTDLSDLRHLKKSILT